MYSVVLFAFLNFLYFPSRFFFNFRFYFILFHQTIFLPISCLLFYFCFFFLLIFLVYPYYFFMFFLEFFLFLLFFQLFPFLIIILFSILFFESLIHCFRLIFFFISSIFSNISSTQTCSLYFLSLLSFPSITVFCTGHFYLFHITFFILLISLSSSPYLLILFPLVYPC